MTIIFICCTPCESFNILYSPGPANVKIRSVQCRMFGVELCGHNFMHFQNRKKNYRGNEETKYKTNGYAERLAAR